MNIFTIVTFCMIGAGALIILSDYVEASTACHATGNWCQGLSHVSTNTGAVGTINRCFKLDTDAVTGCGSGNVGVNNPVWEMNAGSCITFVYRDVVSGGTGTPPLAPNKVTIQVRFDNTNTVIRTYQSLAAEPSNGQQYSFCATNDGLITGSPRAGTYRLYLNVIKDDSVGDVGEYNLDTDGVATVGSILFFDKGGIRAQSLVSSISRNAYPTGSMFAYGTSTDELITITSTFSQPNGDANVETMRSAVVDEVSFTVGEVASTIDVDSATLAQNFIVDNTFTFGGNPYVANLQIVGDAVLTGMRWTIFATSGHGVNIIRFSDTVVYNSDDIIIDSRIKFDKDGIGTFATADNILLHRAGSSSGIVATLFNRGEVVYWESYLLNARSQLLSRSMSFTTHDSVPTQCNSLGSITPLANKYSGTLTVPTAVCLAANDATGSLRTFIVSNTQQTQQSGNTYFASSLYYVDPHTEIDDPLNIDDFPTQNTNEDSSFIISADVTHLWCHVKGIRLDRNIDTANNEVTLSITETDDTTIIQSLVTQTDAGGWTNVSHIHANPVPPARTVHARCQVSSAGNTGSEIQSIGWISAFTADKVCRLWIPESPTLNNTIRVFVQTEKNQAPIQPDLAPQFRAAVVNTTANPETWTDVLVVSMYNVIDDTQTANGALYYYDWTPTIQTTYNVLVVCAIQGAKVQMDYVLEAGMTNLTVSFESTFLLLSAIAYLAFMAESRKDALYWFLTSILSIYLLIERPATSIIPIGVYLGWIFVTLYQAISLLMTKRAQNLSNTEE